jgi:hypothetical protein
MEKRTKTLGIGPCCGQMPLICERAALLLNNRFESGDLVIYTLTKQSPHPGPRARSIHPSESGEDYSYVVDKFWMVSRVTDDRQIEIVTRKGKTRTVDVTDPLLRKATWWEKLRYRNRFPTHDVLKSADGETLSQNVSDSVAAAQSH